MTEEVQKETFTLFNHLFTEHLLNKDLGPKRRKTYHNFIVLVQDKQSGRFAVLRSIDLYNTFRGLRGGTIGYSTAYKLKYPKPEERIANARVFWTPVAKADLDKAGRVAFELALANEDKLFDLKRQATLVKNQGVCRTALYRKRSI